VIRYILPSEDNDDDKLVEIVSDENIVFSLHSLADELIELEDDNGPEKEDNTDGLEIEKLGKEDEAGKEMVTVHDGGEEEKDGNVGHVKLKSALRCMGV
jgi:hypothetical protein